MSNMLKELLSNIKLSYDTATMPIDQRFIFKTFCGVVRAGPSQFSGPQHLLTQGMYNDGCKDGCG